jgi:hypothetical protein
VRRGKTGEPVHPLVLGSAQHDDHQQAGDGGGGEDGHRVEDASPVAEQWIQR